VRRTKTETSRTTRTDRSGERSRKPSHEPAVASSDREAAVGRLTDEPETGRGMIALEEVETVGVVGAGTMGSGIAQVGAQSGYEVVMRDIETEYLDRGFETIEGSLERFMRKGTLTDEEASSARERIVGTTDLDDLVDCELVIEAAVEDMGVKKEVFADLEGIVSKGGYSRRTPVPSRSPRSRARPTASSG
jgi:alanine dehydrogenase